MTSRIGLLGGTFDPIHNGHLEIIKTAITQLKLDKLLIIPAGDPWQKKTVTSSDKRLEMVLLAVEQFKNVEVLDLEVKREGPSYMYETLEYLKQNNPQSELILLLGSDAVAGLDSWKNPNTVKSLARIYVVQRVGDFSQDWHFDHLQMPQVDISSTEIREKVKQGQSLSGLVPTKVAEYISTKSLYKE